MHCAHQTCSNNTNKNIIYILCRTSIEVKGTDIMIITTFLTTYLGIYSIII